jgi:hypothetical protein
MAPTKARIRPTSRLIMLTMGKASAPHSRSSCTKSTRRKRALPAKIRARANTASPMNASISDTVWKKAVASLPTRTKNGVRRFTAGIRFLGDGRSDGQ